MLDNFVLKLRYYSETTEKSVCIIDEALNPDAPRGARVVVHSKQ